MVKGAASTIGHPVLFVEPFAGGASTALWLAGNGLVDRILIGDADPLVASFWRTAAAHTSWLIDRMWDEPVTIARWEHWHHFESTDPDDHELAVKCLYLNRTTFSGILHGRAGPIGGRSGKGKYDIACRFNKDALQRRLEYVGDLYRSNRLVDVWTKDWKQTLDDVAEWYPQLLPDRILAYLDPPYLEKSPTLYVRSFHPSGGYAARGRGVDVTGWHEGREHLRVAAYLRRRARNRWILSYDNESTLLDEPALYKSRRMTPSQADKRHLGIREWRISRRLVNLRYSAAGAGRGRPITELVLTTLPPGSLPPG